MKLRIAAVLAALLGTSLPAATTLMPVEEIKPGMVGVGRTVFEGTELKDFKVHIIGVLRNVQGPRRDLILARLEGAGLAESGVSQGMSGSPVYIDGRLIGAVSYSIGQFSKEPIAGITPIAEMKDATAASPPQRDEPGASRAADHARGILRCADGPLGAPRAVCAASGRRAGDWSSRRGWSADRPDAPANRDAAAARRLRARNRRTGVFRLSRRRLHADRDRHCAAASRVCRHPVRCAKAMPSASRSPAATSRWARRAR